jgi:hypothetical protein
MSFRYRGTNVFFYYNGDIKIGNPNSGTIVSHFSMTSPFGFTSTNGSQSKGTSGAVTIPPGASVKVANFLDDSVYQTRSIDFEVFSLRSGSPANTMARAKFEVFKTKKDSNGYYWMHIIERMY